MAAHDVQPCSRAASDPALARFCAWLSEECGAKGLEAIFFAAFEHGPNQRVRGLGAARDIEKGEEFLCVPWKCLMTIDKVPERLARFAEREKGPETPRRPGANDGGEKKPCERDHAVALYLAEQIFNETSFWRPYFDMLPTEAEYSSFLPAYLHGIDLSEGWQMTRPDNPVPFRIPRYLNRWTGRAKPLVECLDTLESMNDPSIGEFDFQWIYWAFVTLELRSHNPGMLTLIDMANSGGSKSNVRGGTRGGTENPAACYVAMEDIAKDTELLSVDYPMRKHSPFGFFMHYGFAPPPEEFCSESDECWQDNWLPSEMICKILFPDGPIPPAPDVDKIAQNVFGWAKVFCEDSFAAQRAQQASRAAIASSGVMGLCVVAASLALWLARGCRSRGPRVDGGGGDDDDDDE